MELLKNYLEIIIQILLNILSNQITFTVISGVMVYVISQLCIEYFLQPIKDYKELKAKTAYTLTHNAQYYSNPCKQKHDTEGFWAQGAKDMRELASEIDAFAQIRPKYNIFIPSKNTLLSISRSVIGLSNSFYQKEGTLDLFSNNAKLVERIEKILKLR